MNPHSTGNVPVPVFIGGAYFIRENVLKQQGGGALFARAYTGSA